MLGVSAQFCGTQKKQLLENKRGDATKGKVEKKAVDEAFKAIVKELTDLKQDIAKEVRRPQHCFSPPSANQPRGFATTWS